MSVSDILFGSCVFSFVFSPSSPLRTWWLFVPSIGLCIITRRLSLGRLLHGLGAGGHRRRWPNAAPERVCASPPPCVCVCVCVPAAFFGGSLCASFSRLPSRVPSCYHHPPPPPIVPVEALRRLAIYVWWGRHGPVRFILLCISVSVLILYSSFSCLHHLYAAISST